MIASDYRKQLELLLPKGPAYDPQNGSVLLDFLSGMAEELARIDARTIDVLNEADPRTTTELFTEWLETVGIPDGCSVYALTPEDERTQLIQKLTKQAGQTPAFYIDLADALGYGARVEEFQEFLVDRNVVGDPLYDEYWVHSFSLVLDEPPVVARAGVARAGDRLGTFNADFLFCILQTARPAHVVAFVGFE